jgi:N-acetylglutamate synthase-like GNAT family acetyltransferase
MEQTLDEQILSAIELFHYSYKFRENIFSIILDSFDTIEKILPDLKVLQSSRIRTLIITPAKEHLEAEVKKLNERGHVLTTTRLQAEDLPARRSVRLQMSEGQIVVMGIEGAPCKLSEPCSFYDCAFLASSTVGAKKIFFPGSYVGLTVDDEFQSHPSSSDINQILEGTSRINLPKSYLSYLNEKQQQFGIDVIILEAKVGVLFQEIFSHRGSGTLLSSEHKSQFRAALPKDISDIALLMKPYIRSGAILPMSEEAIIDSLRDFYVQTVNEQMVATAKLTSYGEACEIGKICTLPRYQRKGRARAITEKILEVARQQKKKWVFSLSTQDKMFVFFKQLGFREVPREELPEKWLKSYDLTRPSRAFRFDLEVVKK